MRARSPAREKNDLSDTFSFSQRPPDQLTSRVSVNISTVQTERLSRGKTVLSPSEQIYFFSSISLVDVPAVVLPVIIFESIFAYKNRRKPAWI